MRIQNVRTTCRLLPFSYLLASGRYISFSTLAGHTMAPPTCDVMTGRPEPTKADSTNIAPGKKLPKIQERMFFNEISTMVGKLMVEYYA